MVRVAFGKLDSVRSVSFRHFKPWVRFGNGLVRHAVVRSTVLAHLVKIAFWSLPILAAAGEIYIPPLWLFALAIPLSMTGTWLGGLVLERMSDVNFKRWMRWLVTVIGLVYLARAAGFL